MFTVQKGRVSCLSDFNGRYMSSVSEDRIRLNPEMMELSEALDKIANGIL